MPDWEGVRSEFPIVEDCVYLDSASISPSPNFLRESMQEFLVEKEQGSLSCGWREKRQECQRRLAEYLGVDPAEILFFSNTTEGINIVANALEWEPGDEVIISDINFSSNVIPWKNLRRKGVKVKIIQSQDGTFNSNSLRELVSDRTTVISLPHVSSATGHRIDFEECFADIDHNDILVNIDGVQAAGYCRPDLTHVDSYVFSVFKWLLGPFGLGVMYLDDTTADRLHPPMVGYESVAQEPEFQPSTYEFKQGAQKFQYGHVNYPAIYCLSAVLDFLTDIGVDTVKSRIDELTGYLITSLQAIPEVSVVTDPNRRAGIVTFCHDEHDSETIVQELAAKNIHVVERGGRIRAACHIYNNTADIDTLVNELNRL